jgi:hypothetical protein
MSALPLKADMLSVSIDVRLVPQADIPSKHARDLSVVGLDVNLAQQ